MGLKDLLDTKRNALLEMERKQEEMERQRQESEAQRLADEAVVSHPLRGRDTVLLDDYIRWQLVLRNEGNTLDTEGTLLRPFSISLGVPLVHLTELEEEVSFYDEKAKCEPLNALSMGLKQPDEQVCFLCDMARLHGENYSLDGGFLELWRSVCMGVFEVGSRQMAFYERLAKLIAKGEKRLQDHGFWRIHDNTIQYYQDDDFGSLPHDIIQYYLHPLQGRYNQYMVIDLSGGPNASRYPCRTIDKPRSLAEDTCRTTELWLRRIPAGSFMMGSPENELGRKEDEVQHQVELTRDFYIGVFPCTQRQFELVMGWNYEEKGDYPVDHVGYIDLRGAFHGSEWPLECKVDDDSFFGRLQVRTGLPFDLPTEAEWEYACRAGTPTSLNSGKNITSLVGSCHNLDAVGWYRANSNRRYGGCHPVGQKQPNAWGLYDMHGSVPELCIDWYGDYYVEKRNNVDPEGPFSGSYRVLRGGSAFSSAQDCRSARRDLTSPGFSGKHSHRFSLTGAGFRIALRLCP